MLLCDFHIHTKYSDGSVELRRVVDLYGQAGFDVIATPPLGDVFCFTTFCPMGYLNQNFTVNICIDKFGAK